jgi:hypothetical protein
VIGNGTKWIRLAGLVAAIGLASGCGAPSNESTADISGTAPTEGVKAGTPPPKTQAEYAQQYQQGGGTGQSMYRSSGYPGAQ